MIKIEQYRDTWLSEKMDEVIGFYPREFYPLDNFSSFEQLKLKALEGQRVEAVVLTRLSTDFNSQPSP